MAKANVKPIQKTKTNVPVPVKQKTDASVPAHITRAAEEYSGAGVSYRAEDNIVPLIYLLQANSPPAMRGHDRYVEGASAGCIWLRNAPPEIAVIDGDVGYAFQPCNFRTDWIEWLPDRAGFVTRHESRPAEARQKDVEGDDGNVRKSWVMPSGNLVVETRQISGFVHGVLDEPIPYTIPLYGTGHSVAKQWNTTMRDWRVGGKCPPIWAHLFRLTTKLNTKNNNSWYQYSVTHEGYVESAEDLERGRILNEAFVSGEKRSADMENLGDGQVIDGTAGDDM